MMVLWLLLSVGALAETPMEQWNTAVEVVERQQGYRNGEVIKQPAGTWQTLFALVLPTQTPAVFWRPCVHYKVPTQQDGVLRITARAMEDSCEGGWDKELLWESSGLKQLQFSIEGKELRLWWDDGRPHSFRTRMQDIPGVFMLSPITTSKKWPVAPPLLEAGIPCTFKEGTCQRCRQGVARTVGLSDSFTCGIDRCGEKNQPACPRGTRWQKSRGPFGCRGEDTHVFCARGLRVECVGDQAFCR